MGCRAYLLDHDKYDNPHHGRDPCNARKLSAHVPYHFRNYTFDIPFQSTGYKKAELETLVVDTASTAPFPSAHSVYMVAFAYAFLP